MENDNIFIIVGLGNPGIKYEATRHNIGFITVDLFANKFNIKISKIKHKALIGEGMILGKKVVLVKPQTYMNLSGESVLEVVNWYKTDLKNLIVVYDDIDLKTGILRIRPKGSAGSHNGMKSVIYHLQDDDFIRVRIGIGRPERACIDLKDYVMSKFSDEEKDLIINAVENAVKSIEMIIEAGVDKAMNVFNRA